MFGAGSRRRVGRTGPSRINLVRVATGLLAVAQAAPVGENAGGEIATLPSLIRAPPPHEGSEQHLRRKRPQGSGGCVMNPMRFMHRSMLYLVPCGGLSANHYFSAWH